MRELAFIGGRPPGRAACCCCDGGAKVRMFFRLGCLWEVGGEAAPVGCASPGRAVAIAPGEAVVDVGSAEAATRLLAAAKDAGAGTAVAATEAALQIIS